MKKLLLFIIVLFLTSCQSLFFYPSNTLVYHPVICDARPEDSATLVDDGVSVHGWFFRTRTDKPKGTVFFLHGNSQNISTQVRSILWMLDAGYNIFAYDYRGFGVSQGETDMENILSDSLVVFDTFVKAGKEYTTDNIIILGQSLGGAVAVNLAAKTSHQDKINFLLLDSTFSSWRKVYRETAGKFLILWPFQYPISWFISDDNAPVDLIKKLPDSMNILIIHDIKDNIVSFSHAEALHKANSNTLFWDTNTGGHVSAFGNDHIRRKILIFLDNQKNN